MRLAVLLFILTLCAGAQTAPRNRLTFSLGGAVPIKQYSPEEDAPALGLSYGYRALPWFELETGLFTALNPGSEERGAYYDYIPDDRYFWIPFGVRFVAPVHRNRVELSVGGGGFFQRYSVSNPGGPGAFEPYNGWGGYVLASGSVALDRRRRFWVGVTPRIFLEDTSSRRDRWLVVTGEFSFRF
jgi:hypothetical protein